MPFADLRGRSSLWVLAAAAVVVVAYVEYKVRRERGLAATTRLV